MRFIRQPDAPIRLGDVLKSELTDPDRGWLQFRAAVAFVKRGGIEHVAEELAAFARRGSIRISIGIDLGGTSKEGIEALLGSVSANGGEVWIFRNEDNVRPTFHPKLYLFKRSDAALLIISSGNLTSGGLFTNYEGSIAIELDLDDDQEAALLHEVEAALDAWVDPTRGLAHILTPEFLQQLEERGLVQPEIRARGDEVPELERADVEERAPALFGQVPVPRPPRPPRPRKSEEPAIAAVEPVIGAPGEHFVISVLEGDLPQPGSSNEIRITKGIRDKNPVFWGWPDQFVGPDPGTGQFHRDIRIRFGGEVLNAYLKDFPGKKPDGTKASADFRMGSIAPMVRDLREEDDLVILTKSTDGQVDYDAQVVHKSDVQLHERWADGLIQHSRARSTATGTYKKYRYGA